MELVANVWPVVDEVSGLVQRYFMRAYALDAEDQVISATLRALAPTDYTVARGFRIAPRFQSTSAHGTLDGAVPLRVFQQELLTLVEDGFKALEMDYNKLQGIDMSSGSPRPVNVIPRFPEAPYTVVTVLIETFDGRLIPQVAR
jgi:hypothetical protein